VLPSLWKGKSEPVMNTKCPRGPPAIDVMRTTDPLYCWKETPT
jgi:hypothetical protein